MNIVAQTLLDAANPIRNEKPEKIPTIRIKQKYAMPSISLISIIAISFVVIFCFFSVIQINQLNESIQELKKENIKVQNKLTQLESEAIIQNYYNSLNVAPDTNN